MIALDDLRNKQVGLVFSSGFFGFFAHAGCLKAIEELGIKPVGYAGTSSGAIIAALAAAGLNARTVSTILLGLRKDDFWDPQPWYKTAIDSLKLFKGARGYLEGKRFHQLLERNLPVTRFEDLRTPCVIVAVNLTRKKREVFTTGSIADAVQASGTIPWTFKIKNIGNEFYLDGGLIDKVPLEAFHSNVKSQVIIVHYIASSELTQDGNEFLSKRFSPTRAFRQSISIVRHEYYHTQKKHIEQEGTPVIELRPSLPLVTPDRLHLGKEAFEIAYRYVIDYFNK